jgi:hypothetical protein
MSWLNPSAVQQQTSIALTGLSVHFYDEADSDQPFHEPAQKDKCRARHLPFGLQFADIGHVLVSATLAVARRGEECSRGTRWGDSFSAG